jgi:hypothetical protein
MATGQLNRIVEVPIYTSNWECAHCHEVVTPQAIVSVEGSSGEKVYPGNNDLNPSEVQLDLKGKVIGVRLPPHVCASAMAPGVGYDPTE